MIRTKLVSGFWNDRRFWSWNRVAHFRIDTLLAHCCLLIKVHGREMLFKKEALHIIEKGISALVEKWNKASVNWEGVDVAAQSWEGGNIRVAISFSGLRLAFLM